MKRTVALKIETDSTGDLCRVTCRYAVGYYCDAFLKPTVKVKGTHGYAVRCQECKDAELRGRAYPTPEESAKHYKIYREHEKDLEEYKAKESLILNQKLRAALLEVNE